MKIGVLGTRGIPNEHGGFEQFAEYFAVYAAQKGHEVYVYNSSLHSYKEKEFNGVNIIHCSDWEDKIGTAGQFIYDLNCIRDAQKRKFDVLLQLGYTSSAIWYKLLPKDAVIITNMDGLEWKRTKYSKKVQKFLKWSEKCAVKSSDYLISDSIGIQKYLEKEYDVTSRYIAYGAEVFSTPNKNILAEFNVNPHEYYMLIARMEPENNIEMILDGYMMSERKFPFLVIGSMEKTAFGVSLKEKYIECPSIHFMGAIYNMEILNNLRNYSRLYFHGHSVGGTNPSLLEAMASGACISAHHNDFNESVLQQDAYYFFNEEEVKNIIDKQERNEGYVQNNYKKIKEKFSWRAINQSYLDFMEEVIGK